MDDQIGPDRSRWPIVRHFGHTNVRGRSHRHYQARLMLLRVAEHGNEAERHFWVGPVVTDNRRFRERAFISAGPRVECSRGIFRPIRRHIRFDTFAKHLRGPPIRNGIQKSNK
jgi:hypothetical protein